MNTVTDKLNSILRTLISCWPLIAVSMATASDNKYSIDWQAWSPAAFADAERQGKLVLLNLEAVWCHWCHVMDQQTYSDPAVATVIADHFIAIKVDHDAQPDLANRYRAFGWPATIVLSADGTDLIKRAGYIEADRFTRQLQAIAANPVAERDGQSGEPKEFVSSPLLSNELRERLEQRQQRTYDWKLGGLRSKKKSMDRDSTEYAMLRALGGDENATQMARKTIDASLALIDPEWGGAYQYSTGGDWQHPHYEKIMATQAGYLRIYSLAFLQWDDSRYLDAAKDIERYLADFLSSPDGAYYTSQDADLVQGTKGHTFFAKSAAKRSNAGMPRIDTNIYARENGWAIEAVATLYQATGDSEYLRKAIRATDWMLENRSLDGGGYRHGGNDASGPFLADTLNMGRAFLQLYRVTADRRWLTLAADAANFIARTFAAGDAGFLSGAAGGPVTATANIDENISAVRFLNLLAHTTGDEQFSDAAEFGMRYLATPAIATQRREESGILLAASELGHAPGHFTVVGAKQDMVAAALYKVALNQAGWYQRVEWWDLDEGPLPNPDVQYPSFDRASAYVCTDSRCSLPAFMPDDYRSLITRISAQIR